MFRLLRYLLLLLVLLPVGVLVAAGAALDSAWVRQQVIGAVERSTGHGFRLDGPMRVVWSLPPGIEARDAVVLNPPGFSRPALATARLVNLRLALSPLLAGRIELSNVTMSGVDVKLERDASGRGNWLPPPSPPPAQPTAAPVQRTRTPVAVRRLVLEDARLAWWGGPAATVPTMVLHPAGGAVSGQVLLNGVLLTVQGRSGPTDHGPVAVDLAVQGAGASLTLAGAAGAQLDATADVADLSSLSQLVGQPLPPLKHVAAQAAWGPDRPHAMRLTAAESDLAPGVHLTRLAAWSDGPATLSLTADGTYRALPASLAFNAFGLDALISGVKVPVQLELHADGGSLRAQGLLDRLARTFDGTVAADIPDLGRTAALAGLAAPTLNDVHLEARALPAPGAVLLRGVRASARQGDLAGDLAVGTGAIPSLRGTLVSQRLDLDDVHWAAPPPVSAAAPSPTPATPGPPPKPAAPRLLPFPALRGRAADLHLTAVQLRLFGLEWRGLETRVLLQDGRLRVDPLRMLAPGGALEAQLLADASAEPPTAAIMLRGAGLDAAGLAAALGNAGAATGQLDLDTQLHGTGRDWRTMAATLDGHAGLAFVDGEIENRVIAALLGDALRAANLPSEPSGRSKVRCLAMRADAAAGQVALRSLALDSTRLRLEADGSINLADETVDLHLRPTLRLGGAAVVVPVHLLGPWRGPKASVDRGVIAPGRLGFSIGAPETTDTCGPALAAARAR